jgi:hypothetical protein
MTSLNRILKTTSCFTYLPGVFVVLKRLKVAERRRIDYYAETCLRMLLTRKSRTVFSNSTTDRAIGRLCAVFVAWQIR